MALPCPQMSPNATIYHKKLLENSVEWLCYILKKFGAPILYYKNQMFTLVNQCTIAMWDVWNAALLMGEVIVFLEKQDSISTD